MGEALEAIKESRKKRRKEKQKEVHKLVVEGGKALEGAKTYKVELGCRRPKCDWTQRRTFTDIRKDAGTNAVSIARLVDHPQHADDIFISSIAEVKE